MPELSKADILEILKKRSPKKGIDIMEALGRGQQFLRVMETPVGQELLSILENGITQTFNKIVTLEASDEDKIRWLIYKDLLDKICRKILDYYNLKDQIAKGEKG